MKHPTKNFYTIYDNDRPRYSTKEVINKKPCMTIPDQTMSMKELIARYTRGIPINAALKNPVYLGDEPTLPFESMDFADRLEAAKQIKQYITEKRNELNTPHDNTVQTKAAMSQPPEGTGEAIRAKASDEGAKPSE